MSRNLTAVQWLEIVINNKLTSEMGPYFAEAFEQAKEMEKQQIVETYNEGALDGLQLGEQYYNFVYGTI
jgi:hypothetical protein